jgi:hypothetical protein
MSLTIHNDDNLAVLQRLADAGERFDLIELDGPYAAGLEGWDCLTEDEYLAHYTARLPLVARCLQPWGVSFLFGYPEGCAEIKTWARQTGTLHLRRWLTWYKQVTAHKGRKVETILVFTQQAKNTLSGELKNWLRDTRRSMGLTITQAMAITPSKAHLSGKGAGMMWYEALSSSVPTAPEYHELKQIFGVPDYFDYLLGFRSFDDLTNLDYIGRHYSEDSRDLNDNGLRSKPVGLYLDLFRPTVPPRETKHALILYGGSGNAAIAAGQLGYDVTVCETDAARCEYIRRRWAWKVERRDETPVDELGPLFNMFVEATP